MFIEKVLNNGIEYLRLAKGKRVTNEKGKKVVRRDIILNIGPLSKFDDGQPDYLGRLRESFKNGTPLIDSLLPYVSAEKEPDKYTFTFTQGDLACIGHPKYYAQCLLDKVFSELGLAALFATLKHDSRIAYDLQGFVRLLVFGRILNPGSKYSTISQDDDYSTPLLKSDYPYNVYDTLDILYQNKEKIIRRMNTSIVNGMGRKPNLVFYDVTNFFFEIEEADEDFIIDGETIKGLRKNGVSKEHRKQPIVQMGLFMDEMGIPITIEAFPGNTLDQATLRPAMKKTVNQLGFSRFILVADRGLCSYKNICHVLDEGHGYIVSKSIKKTQKTERDWILEPAGYQEKGDGFRYKSRQYTRTIDDENGEKREITEQVVVYWSESFWKREYHEHESFLDFIQKLRESPSSFRVTASQSKSLERFFKKEVVNLDTGELLDSSKLLSMIDEKKLEEYTALMGYYQITTSELEMNPLDVIDKYHGLTMIEDLFREMKGTLDTRPVFVRTPEHIQAHLLICLMALTILRIIQKVLAEKTAKNEDDKRFWSFGLSGERVQRALQKWKIESFPDEFYRFVDIDDADLKLILNAFEINLQPQFYSRGDLKKIKSGIKVFM